MTEALSSILDEPFPWVRHPLDPPDAYQALRETQPVVRVRMRSGQPVWLITRYDDVRAILADPRVSADDSRAGYPRFGERPSFLPPTFLHMDAPDHTMFRRVL